MAPPAAPTDPLATAIKLKAYRESWQRSLLNADAVVVMLWKHTCIGTDLKKLLTVTGVMIATFFILSNLLTTLLRLIFFFVAGLELIIYYQQRNKEPKNEQFHSDYNKCCHALACVQFYVEQAANAALAARASKPQAFYPVALGLIYFLIEISRALPMYLVFAALVMAGLVWGGQIDFKFFAAKLQAYLAQRSAQASSQSTPASRHAAAATTGGAAREQMTH